MIEKHPLSPELKNLHFSPEMLKKEWKEIFIIMKDLVHGGYTNLNVIALMEYIMSTDYASNFYPGVSLGHYS